MLTLDTVLHIPGNVSFSIVGEDAFLLNTRTNKYFRLEEVGTRLWGLLNEGRSLKDAHRVILGEYEVDSGALEQDLLELIDELAGNGLVEVA